jgi:multidrug efflux pump subunit AcrA (membrane-fusion protein)
MMNKALRGVAGFAILAFGLMVMNALIGMKETPAVKPRSASARMVKGMPALNATLAPEVAIEGRVQALNRMTILSEVNGMIPVGGKELREGVAFSQGEAMLRLDDSELRANLVAQRSQWLQLVASCLADIQIDFPDRSDEWRALVQDMQVEERLPALPEPKTDRERLYLTSRGVISGYHNIVASEERLDKYTLRAPFEGVATGVLVQPGSMVRAGQPIGTLVGTGAFEVKSAVHARHLSVVAVGDDVVLTQENGEVVARGTVSRISGNVDPTTQSASVHCEVRATEGHVLRDGRFLSGRIQGRPMDGVMQLDEALIEGDDEVYVIRDGRLDVAKVTVKHKDQDAVLVEGLEPGETLLAEPVSGAHVGMLVDPIQR